MWASAQRDGRPTEYRWRLLFNVAVWLSSNATKTRNPLKFDWVPQTNERISAVVGLSSPCCEKMRRRYCRDRYLAIWKFLHVVDEDDPSVDKLDKLYKIQPLLNNLISKSQENYKPHQEMSLDEGMIPAKIDSGSSST